MNMRNILLVAGREFRQVVALKSFWLTLLLIPVALALGPLLGDRLRDTEPDRVIVVDRAGGSTARALQDRFALERDRAMLNALSRYVRRHDLERADPQAIWAQSDRWFTPADVARFREDGGSEAALASIARIKPAETPEFDPPDRAYRLVPEPEALAGKSGDALKSAADALLAADKDAPEAARADIVLVIGEDYPADPTVRLWANEQPRQNFIQPLQEVLTFDLRQQMLGRIGVSRDQSLAIQSAAPRLAIATPPPGGGAREAMLVRSIVPLAMAYILMMGLILSGSWMLQGSIEERSKKLLESLLACISPEELMYGKLLGALAIGISMLVVWLGAGVAAALATHGAIADMIRPALAPVTGFGPIATLTFFFLGGYIAISIIFVAIGSMADSMSEAQGYLMPLLLLILLPVSFLIQAILAGNSGPLVQILTWVPLWTPFAVLARLGSGISTVELIGAAAVLSAFIALEVIFLGRLFRASLLAEGQQPGLKVLFERLRASRAH